jgi:hypothetical protein
MLKAVARSWRELVRQARSKLKQKGASVMSDEVVDLYEGDVIYDEIEVEEAEQVIALGIILTG